jgi:hypothetical protein
MPCILVLFETIRRPGENGRVYGRHPHHATALAGGDDACSTSGNELASSHFQGHHVVLVVALTFAFGYALTVPMHREDMAWRQAARMALERPHYLDRRHGDRRQRRDVAGARGAPTARRSMDRLLALQCFCRVVETGGFAAAARDLDISSSMVTKYIRHLEEWTGSRLLARTTRRMQLTEAGEHFYAYCRRILDDTESTLGAIRAARGELSGRLVLAVPVSLTLAFLKDHLHEFQAAHPAIELELKLSDRPVDLVRDGIDVARILARSPRRPRKMNTWPPHAFSWSVVCIFSARAGKSQRMSVTPISNPPRVPRAYARPIVEKGTSSGDDNRSIAAPALIDPFGGP